VSPAAGTGTTGGNAVHQHGPSPPSAIAQPKDAPQRVQVLMAQPAEIVNGTWKDSWPAHLNGARKKLQQEVSI